MKTGSAGPVLIVLAVLLVAWYAAALWLNAPWQMRLYERAGTTVVPFTQFALDAFSQDKPILPAPHQIVSEMWKATAEQEVTSRRSFVYHGWITLSSTLLGFAFGTVLGVGLATLILHNGAMDRSLMPWIIASQTVPILALAPMLVVGLSAVGVSGLVTKAIISTYLSFFPIVVGMVKGLSSPGRMQLDLMRTYSASRWQVFWKLRWPAAMPFLFTSMKVGIAISLIGALVGELTNTGGGGLGVRLLTGSYNGQTIVIWAVLLAAATLAGLLVLSVEAAEKLVLRQMGVRPA